MSKVLVRGSRRGVLMCAFAAALLCAAGAMAADFNDRGNIVIADQFNLSHQIVWQYGMTLVPGAGSNQLNNPNSAELLQNGHVLIADENNNRVIEVTTGKQLVRQFTAGGTVSGAAFASRLRNGNTLITDARSEERRVGEEC